MRSLTIATGAGKSARAGSWLTRWGFTPPVARQVREAGLAARLRARQRLHQRMVKGEAMFTIIGVVLLFAFGRAFYEGF